MITRAIFAVTLAVGCLQHCAADLPAFGNCPFMEYYCTLREYESHFFKRLYEDPAADCGLQFWILYYRSLHKTESCLGNSKRVDVANIREIQILYCSGFDLEVPLVFSLSPCSDKHKNKVEQCVNDFATTFSKDRSDPSLCRKRGKAKTCTTLAWQTMCNPSDKASAVLNSVIGAFNPFCNNDKDPWATETDQCASYRIPYSKPKCDRCPGDC
ncbi:hypothetical protein ACROYT_G034403 [Oculina patagonica]